MIKPEILSPCGDMECLESALSFGADAVYLAGRDFGMRTASKNFSVEELKIACEKAHKLGKKVYLTCNTLPRNDDVKNMINIDFSVISDTHYYNGIVFKGFIEGIPASVLSGGQYDKLMLKMKRKSGAIGFAVYLDMLEMLFEEAKEYDVDIVILYDNNSDLSCLNKIIESYLNNNESVYACKQIPKDLQYKSVINFNECEVD